MWFALWVVGDPQGHRTVLRYTSLAQHTKLHHNSPIYFSHPVFITSWATMEVTFVPTVFTIYAENARQQISTKDTSP
jgi:hypothetical protein